jgi:small subunit ribosomal protein S17e
VDRIKRLSYEVLDEHKPKFGEDFADNKKVLDQIAIIRSKGLKNEIAGYITKFIKKENREEKVKQSQIESSKIENYTLEEKVSEDDAIEDQTIEIISEPETSDNTEE